MSSVTMDDVTAKARIRDAALARFPKDGFGATTMRAVAEDAGVSPALVVHHFGSKDGLRAACDAHVLQVFRETKQAAMEESNLSNPGFAAEAFQAAEPITRYLAWALSRNHGAAASFFDDFVQEALVANRMGIEAGLLVDSDDLERRTVVQVAMQLGAMVLSPHVERNIGVGTASIDDLQQLTPVFLELFSGLFTPAVLEQVRAVHTGASQPDAARKDE